jgi:EAL domain-containing protein (putative c-di-GMP-specific phosphodiesterase class I)
MYTAKAHHTRVEVYDPVHGAQGRNRIAMAKQLRIALEENQFEIHYQPKVDLDDGQIIGVEALVRWRHPELGLLYPDSFLPVAEQIGCFDALTRTVLTAAIAQCRSWRQDGLDLTVAVNLAASNLTDDDLVDDIAATLAEYDIPSSSLTLEITEGTLIMDQPRATATLEAINRLGVTLSVDDYGTGFSSLTYLRDLPVHELKIDRSFITDLSQRSRDDAIVRSTIELGHALGLQVIAEGVENAEALALLEHYGCDVAQGYYLCRPQPASELTAWLGTQTVRSLGAPAGSMSATTKTARTRLPSQSRHHVAADDWHLLELRAYLAGQLTTPDP